VATTSRKRTPRPLPMSVVCSTRLLPRMLFIERISRPSMPST
jgi:hypothetical protein